MIGLSLRGRTIYIRIHVLMLFCFMVYMPPGYDARFYMMGDTKVCFIHVDSHDAYSFGR